MSIIKQADIIRQISSEDLKKSVFYTQFILLSISIVSSFILFDNFTDWFVLFKLNPKDIFYYGIIPAIIVIALNIILSRYVPNRYLDDGGINEKLFKSQSVFSIIIIALTIAIAEELLFRGVIQTVFGYIFASSLFAIIHIRYLKKPVLLISIIIVSFYIGYLFEVTQNLLVTITAHFIIDFILGLLIKYKTRGEQYGRRNG